MSELREGADEALYDAVYTLFLEGTFAPSPEDRREAARQFHGYLDGVSFRELVSLLCMAWDELVVAQMELEERK